MAEPTAVPSGACPPLGVMTGIDARRIIAGRHGMSLDEMRVVRARLGNWLGVLNALKKDAGREAAHCGPCLAFSLCDNIDLTISETGIEEVIDALDGQIRDAADACLPAETGNRIFHFQP